MKLRWKELCHVPTPPRAVPVRARSTLGALVAVAMLGAAASSLVEGSPPAVAAPKSRESGGPSAEDVRNAAAMTPSDRMAMVQGMVDRLASRLVQSPRDADGWIKLMRSRKVLGDTEAAEQTFRLALDVFKDDPREQEQISAAARELDLIK